MTAPSFWSVPQGDVFRRLDSSPEGLTSGVAERRLAKRVSVKRLAAIENFGSMDVLCSDKTGSLTEGRIDLQSAIDAAGQESERVPVIKGPKTFSAQRWPSSLVV